jgi:hypothetical protein
MVIARDYNGKNVVQAAGACSIAVSLFKPLLLNKNSVETYEVITDEHRKSAAGGIGRGIVGGALLGPVGLIGGALSAKNKGTYQVAIQFKDGKKSLLEIDDKVYKALVKSMF